jgi:predicted DNA-binding protein (MmcQ/YjbR family)
MDLISENTKIDFDKLLSFGFKKKGNSFLYSADIVDGQFKMTVTVTRQGQISAEVLDAASHEAYVLHLIPDASGSFVGRVRSEYEAVLSSIEKSCFESDIFKCDNTLKIIRHAKNMYQSEPEFLWKQYPRIAVLRRTDNNKWYAVLFRMEKNKLGLGSDGDIEIMDVRVKPEVTGSLIDREKYLPGYHMNKKHWLTVCLDGRVETKEILARVDESFVLAKK